MRNDTRGRPPARRALWLGVLALAAGTVAIGSVAGRPAVDAADDAAFVAHLPLAVRGFDRAATPLPTATAWPATSVPTPTATATATPSVTPTPRPLAERLVEREIEIDGRIARAMGTWTSFPIVTAPRYDGSRLVGWSDTTGQVHVTPLGRDGAREGPDLTFAGASIHGLVAHAGGGAALYVLGDEMRLRRFDDDGAVAFEHALVGTDSHGRDGAKWIDDWSHEGRLAWTGDTYAAYFGHTQNWGSDGKHQGDLLWLFDAAGERITGSDIPSHYPGWDWGCSHSIDLRLTYNADSDRIGPVCLSDEFPQDGAVFSRSHLIAAMPGDGGGRVEGELGGLVHTAAGFTLTFVSRTDRSSYDVGLAYVSEYGFPTFDTWLTDTPRIQETSAHLARYGDDLLVSWHAGGEHLLSVMDIDGNVLEGPLAIEAEIAPRDDFVSYEDGRAGWTYAAPDRQSLISVVVDLP